MVSKQRILVIDDDVDTGELVSAVASTMGFQCTATIDPKTFQEQLAPGITLILLDLVMPEMDGIQLLRLLGERKCKASIVLMSGLGKRILESAERLAQILGLSIVGHLQKPLQVDELREVLQRLPEPEARNVVHPSPPYVIRREELRNALDRNEFVVYYQPQIDIATARAIGVEALVRWQHPTQGLIFPDSFIGCAERFGLIDELGWVVANCAMSETSQFANGDGHDFRLSLNASVDSLFDLNFPDTLESIAAKHGVAPSNVTVEITESCEIKELSRTLDILTRLRMKQFKLAIDDFGTGYAMMRQFNTIAATELKIDRSFIHGMLGDDRNCIMVQKTIEMGHELGMQVVAEGVETQEQLDLLRANGCDSVQGYFYSRPIPAREMVSWLKAYRLQLAHSGS
jgi:EAL domain-containing protein (putative c-di-GMP-specific phosphodiesterase class I)/CheY-like chemotaxis protein